MNQTYSLILVQRKILLELEVRMSLQHIPNYSFLSLSNDPTIKTIIEAVLTKQAIMRLRFKRNLTNENINFLIVKTFSFRVKTLIFVSKEK